MICAIKKTNLMEIIFEVSVGFALIHQLNRNVLPNSLKYSVIIFWIIIWIILRKGSFKKRSLRLINLQASPYILFGILSIPMWFGIGTTFTDKGYLSFLFSHVIYVILRCTIVIVALDLFGERAFKVMFRALIFSQLVIVLYTGYLYGYGNLLSFCLTGVFKAVTNTTVWGSAIWNIGWALEVHDNTFAFGFFILYFIYYEKDKRSKIIGILVSAFFMYIGFKRIQLLAIGCVVIINFIFKFMRINYNSFSKIYTIVYLAIATVFIGLIKISPEVFSTLDINRIALYEFLGTQINSTKLVLGSGWGSINYYLQFVNNSGLLQSSHSDLIRIFIEMGLIVFVIWICYFHIIVPKKIEKETRNKNAGELAFLCAVYLFITYFIDNTLELYAVHIIYMFVPLAVCLKD